MNSLLKAFHTCCLPLLLMGMLGMLGCASPSVYAPVQPEAPVVGQTTPSQALMQYNAPLPEPAKPPAIAKEVLQPKFKELSPLDMERINISFVEEGYRQVFQVLARAAGLNLVLDPQLEALLAPDKLTAEYQQIEVRAILNAISNIFNVAWRENTGLFLLNPISMKSCTLIFLAQSTPQISALVETSWAVPAQEAVAAAGRAISKAR